MDFQQFGIDERLLSGVPSLRAQALFHEKMLTHALKQGENVYARLSVSSGREAIYLLPALQWLAAGQGSGAGRILCLVPDVEAARKSSAAALSIGSGIGLESCIVSLEGEGTVQPAPAAAAPILEGNPRASFVTGSLEALLAAKDLIGLADFGYLLVDGAERIAELPSERIRYFSSALRPSSERRAIVVCGRNSVKAKNLAWDLSENPVEFHIEEEAAKAQSVAQESWHIASDRKLRFLLGLLARRRPTRTCVFCNLKSGAEELALRLRYNGVEADYILGSLPPDRKAAILADLEAEEGSVLVLTDEGAAGLKGGTFPLVVNYDIPLDPELYVRRLEMLDRAGASSGIVNLACDRYVYGLPAVEQYIDASLDAKPVDESLLRAEDKSADLAFERPRFDREAPRGAPQAGKLVAADTARNAGGDDGHRHGPDGGRGPGGARSDGHGRSGQRRGGRDDDFRQGRSDRSPDIRRKIAEATGGSLDMEGGPTQGQPARDSRPHQQSGQQQGQGGRSGKGGRNNGSGRGAGHGNDAGRQQGGRRDGGRGQGGDGRGGNGQGRGARPQPGRPQQGRQQAARDGNRSPDEANPYSLSTEERMQRYREKYGQSGQDRPTQSQSQRDGAGQGRKPAQSNGQKRAGSTAGRADGRGEGKAQNWTPKRGSAGQGNAARGNAAPRPPAPVAPVAPVAAPEKQGFFGKLFGLRKKKDSGS